MSFTDSPSKPSILEMPNFPWLEKTQGYLTCNVTDKGNPPITEYTWFNESTVIANRTDEILTLVSLTNLDHKRMMSCRVYSYNKTAFDSKVVTLDVECK